MVPRLARIQDPEEQLVDATRAHSAAQPQYGELPWAIGACSVPCGRSMPGCVHVRSKCKLGGTTGQVICLRVVDRQRRREDRVAPCGPIEHQPTSAPPE